MQPNTIYIYTDGAAQGNPGPGGYGVVMKYQAFEKELCDGFRRTTNNRMELLAVIKGLEEIKREGIPVIVVSDSKYVTDAFNLNWVNGWIKKQFKDVKNPDLWKMLIPLAKKYQVKFQWIKGHNGHPENERCDELAVMMARKATKVDTYYESLSNS